MAENIERIETLGHRLMTALADRQPGNPGVEAPGPDLYVTATNAFLKTLTEQPGKMMGTQVSFWGETLANYVRAQKALAKGQLLAPEDDGPADKRFANPLWQSHPFFNLIKTQYLTNARALRKAADSLDLPDEVARRRIDWLTAQIVDMMAPTNFLATNPDALERAVQTEGESLVKGLENLVRDVEQHGGEMIVSLADRRAFTVGDNIGTAPGTVVHRAPLFELIQYAPTTPQAHTLPLVIFPPWINKFYILDLKPQNSLIRWLVEQGQTLFVVSWKNPDASFSETGMEDYVTAYIEAMDKILELTGQSRLNTVGYCIAGTTLTLTLALLKQRGDRRVNSATLFTTLTDFSDQGEFTSFLQDDFVNGIDAEIRRHGMLPARLMSRTMSFLRANDLVWGPAIRSYMMGETPPAFDLLFWNGDATNLPGRMAMQYLRGLCQDNHFAGEGFDLLGHKLHVSDVTVPLCAVACESDHIAPWKDCWRGVSQMGSTDRTFILSQSGHVAGIVNPPTRKKYGHYLSEAGFDGGHQAWREGARFAEGSWWPHWGRWLAERSGPLRDARDPGEGLDPAPGRYVHERAG
ncbi:class I poly(R)-hydroxyalkanoic acid synthase [Paracoccus liaowanqingii]|uniref:Class I poly(R)-hydroxyalkanoic acid synthase n=1 Tax=Paracoccus liaowanqingii TaxID=2560053 RepID=A0A4Z1CAQ6_9RHOB|nr:class I poly(R)-hydroxyalkanoic acid synthase [Paracoccus liaowanqingii]TGN55494.1 class I poly(R)-hydroxyalkanoic acid synthase [Paracoccus liaowanqingii]